MYLSALHRSIDCRTLSGHYIRSIYLLNEKRSALLRTELHPVLHVDRTECSKNNATLRLDSSLETPTVIPPADRFGSSQLLSC